MSARFGGEGSLASSPAPGDSPGPVLPGLALAARPENRESGASGPESAAAGDEIMLDSERLLSDLAGLVDAPSAEAVTALVRGGGDFEVNRVNPLAFAARHGLDEGVAIGALLQAARLGLFEMNWNIVCNGCGGVLNIATSLKAIDKRSYFCALCTVACEPVLDDMVEVTFTLDPRVRAIAAHAPDRLSQWDYVRQVYWSSGADLPADLEPVLREVTLDAVEVPSAATVTRVLDLPPGPAIVFDPVSHASTVLDVAEAPVQAAQSLAIGFGLRAHATESVRLAPGRLYLTLSNRGSRRALPLVWRQTAALGDVLGRRVPILTAKRLLSHQTFRDIHRTGVLDVDQYFKIRNLTFLFTDLKGSTGLYERVGDLAAFDLVRAHFRVLTDIVAAAGGAVVKTIGDAIMASFPTEAAGMTAALRMRGAMEQLNAEHGSRDLLLKIGLHAGPSLAVALNDRQDYFGQTVNIAARVQALAPADRIFATAAVLDAPEARALVETGGHDFDHSSRVLRGMAQEVDVYEIS